eukprot:TRINITY_DN29243_c0_g2_i1.p1 TRINITY_DN29243_c0_g2~~TRINITY_DN29243_c0_g2_i1.p1  ORF type:complete len:515 (-),score=30.89 TRINITY_DN29243_c0_g2_i1:101-1531(-)
MCELELLDHGSVLLHDLPTSWHPVARRMNWTRSNETGQVFQMLGTQFVFKSKKGNATFCQRKSSRRQRCYRPTQRTFKHDLRYAANHDENWFFLPSRSSKSLAGHTALETSSPVWLKSFLHSASELAGHPRIVALFENVHPVCFYPPQAALVKQTSPHEVMTVLSSTHTVLYGWLSYENRLRSHSPPKSEKFTETAGTVWVSMYPAGVSTDMSVEFSLIGILSYRSIESSLAVCKQSAQECNDDIRIFNSSMSSQTHGYHMFLADELSAGLGFDLADCATRDECGIIIDLALENSFWERWTEAVQNPLDLFRNATSYIKWKFALLDAWPSSLDTWVYGQIKVKIKCYKYRPTQIIEFHRGDAHRVHTVQSKGMQFLLRATGKLSYFSWSGFILGAGAMAGLFGTASSITMKVAKEPRCCGARAKFYKACIEKKSIRLADLEDDHVEDFDGALERLVLNMEGEQNSQTGTHRRVHPQ